MPILRQTLHQPPPYALSAALPRLFFMTDTQTVPNWRAVLAHLPKKSGVILRDYHHPKREPLARDMATVCQDYNHLLLIGADVRLAHKLSLGLHMPERLAPRLIWHWAQYSKRARHRRPLTMAAHSLVGIRRAAQLGVDGVFLAPVFATPSHPKAAPLGVIRLASLCQYARICGSLPIFALGGMDRVRWQRINACGAYGYAAIRAFAPANRQN